MRKVVILFISILFVCVGPSFADGRRIEKDALLERSRELFGRGRWSDARNELLRVRPLLGEASEREQVDYLLAVCAIELGSRDAETALKTFEERYPGSSHTNGVRLRLASYYCSDGNYDRAREAFERVDYDALDGRDRERYDVRRGYIAFAGGDYRSANVYFSRIGSGSEYADHALYYTSYIDYAEGNYARAESGFKRLLSSTAYKALAPFYLLQIHFKQGDYAYVVDKAPALIRMAAPRQQVDLLRVTAESWFRLDDYPKAAAALAEFRAKGGEMGRDEYYIEGYSLYRMARYDEAAASLRLACGADDALTQNASYHLADCYLRRGDKLPAMQAFAMAANAKFNPLIAEQALFDYGKLQYELGGGRFNEAINVLGRCIAEYPASKRVPEARRLLAAAYYNTKDYDAAYEALKRLPDPDGEMRAALQKIAYFRGLEAYERGELEAARRFLAESGSVNVSPKYTSLAAFWQGEIAYAKGEWEAARRHYETYLRRAPRSEREYAMALYNLGYCDFSQQRMTDAGRRFDEFLAVYPAVDEYRADALNRLGDTRFAARQFDKALESYDTVISAGLNSRYYAQYQRAVVLGILGRTQEKVRALGQIIASDRGDYLSQASYELGRTYLAEEKYDDGARALERFVATYPHSPKYTAALSDLGLVYLNLGERDKSLQYYDRVVKNAPNSPEAKDALHAIREIYVGSGEADAYFAYAEQAGAEGDLSAVARDSLSFAAAQKLYLADRTDLAARSLRSYVKSFPKGFYRTDALYYLSECYLRSGEREEAIQTLSELVEQGRTQYTTDALEKLASMTEADARYAQSAAAYRMLADAGPESARRALEGYVRTSVAAGDDDAVLQMAVLIASRETEAGERAVREARFAKAKVLERRGDVDEALSIYENLSGETRTAEGAEALYRVIEAAHRSGDDKRAEKLAFDFSESNSPQSYWLAKSFLVLGDIYLARDDAFQARATYQSVVDGYTPGDDGIVAEAKKRIAKMNEP